MANIGAILVVAANDGAMPQTREHILLAKQIGIQNVIIYINKVDAADEEMAELVELEMRDLMTEMGYDGESLPVIRGSALCALKDEDPKIGVDSINNLLNTVDKFIPTPERDLDKPFVMPIENVYSVGGRGTVVTGCVSQGTLRKGGECEIMGYNKTFKTTITGIEMYHKSLESAQGGDQLGAMVRGVKRDDLRRGMILAKPGLFKMHDHVDAQVYVLTKEEGGRSKPFVPFSVLRIYSKTWDYSAQVNITDGNIVMPGEHSKYDYLLLNLFYRIYIVIGFFLFFAIID